MKISIVGAGNTGCAAAAFFSELSHQVTLYTRDRTKAEFLNREGITASGKLNGKFKLKAVYDIKEAVRDAEYICIFTKANHHKETFKAMSGLLENKQRILIFNCNWGAYEATGILGSEVESKNIILAETSSMPFIANSGKTGEVELFAVKNQLGFSTFKKSDSAIMLAELKTLFNDVVVHENIIESSLISTNPIIHAPITLFNIVRIEEADDFGFYADGTSPLCVDFIEKIDKERIMIGRKLGIEIPGILETINSYWVNKYDNLLEALRKNYPAAKAPKTVEHRYIDEDLPYGILPIVSLGKLLGVETPYSTITAEIFTMYTSKNFNKETIDFNLDKIYEITGGIE